MSYRGQSRTLFGSEEPPEEPCLLKKTPKKPKGYISVRLYSEYKDGNIKCRLIAHTNAD